MNIIAIIPARMGSSRFPGKPLAPLHGVPMLGHVYLRTKRNTRLSGVYIATCDEEIRTYARSIGAECVMTSSAHTRASDRTAEAARHHRAQRPAARSTPSSWFRETSRCSSRR